MRLFAVALLVCGACRREAVVSGEGELRADPRTLDFDDVWVAGTGRGTVTIQNTGSAERVAALEATAPFGVQPALVLAGGESRSLEITFVPARLGQVSGLLTVRAGTSAASVALLGIGVEPPPCDSTVCRDARLDDETARCVLSAKPDGTACGAACVLSGVCAAGSCVGTARDCDDLDPCTTDACDSLQGCVHVPRGCTPSSACAQARCMPGIGCVETTADDGASCGDSDCTSALVCIAGQCVSRAVPEGAPCGTGSICRPRGRCAAGRCDQPDAGVLTPQWSHAAPPAARLRALVGDPLGYVVAECVSTGSSVEQCTLVGFGAAGGERWRTPLPHVSDRSTGSLDLLLLAGSRVVASLGAKHLEAFDVATGAKAWSVDLSGGVLGGPAPQLVRPAALAVDAAGNVLMAVGEWSSSGGSRSGLLALDGHTGGVLRRRALPGQGLSLVFDRPGNLFILHRITAAELTDAVSALDPAWNLLWQRPLAGDQGRTRSLLGTHRGRLLLTQPMGLELRSTASGAIVGNIVPPGLTAVGLVWSDEALFTHSVDCPVTTCLALPDLAFEVVAVENASLAQHRTALPRLRGFSSAWLTSRGSSLLGLATTVGAELFETDARGRVLMECPLAVPPTREFRTDPVLDDGRWAVITGEGSDGRDARLEVWVVPGYDAAATGWLSPRGGPGLDQRAR